MLPSNLMALFIGTGHSQQWIIPVLVSAGFLILEAADVLYGIRLATCRKPDIVIIDENVLRRTSANLLSALKGAAEAPVLVVGSGAQGNLLLAVRQGGDHYLDPSTSPKELLARVHSLLRRHLWVKVGERLATQFPFNSN